MADGPPLHRDAQRTRAALLDAAVRAMVAHGPGVSLELVARDAGVSKGGLLHHFPTREALLVAVVDEWMRRLDDAVTAHLDPADDRPGRRARAHIRAAFDEDTDEALALWRHKSVVLALLSVPEVLDRARETGQRWRRELAADGLHRQRAVVIARALDGTSLAELVEGGRDPHERAEMRSLLMALTQEPGPLVADPSA